MAGAFRRGFKTEAERIALELRAEVGVAANERLDPALLARHLHIPVLTLHHLASEAPDAVRHFLGIGRTAFSAATIYLGRHRRAIITNPAHATTRQMSSLCHEVSHIVLDHEAGAPTDAGRGRAWNPAQEHEADWLAGCLLIPDAAALSAARAGRSAAEVAYSFGVSDALATWRMNVTGAFLRAQRLARFR